MAVGTKNTRSSSSSYETLEGCPVCAVKECRELALPGHWIGSEVFEELRGRIGLVRCGGCGLVYTNPRPSGDRLQAYYSGNTYVCHETAGSASGGAKAALVLDRVERRLSAATPRTLLDYGCGGGAFLLNARGRGWDVSGFEPGRRGLETCRGLRLHVTDDASVLPRRKFGLITLHHVLEHIAEPGEALQGLRELLAPEGRLFVEVPNAGSLRARMALPALSRTCGVDERYRAFPIHLMYYNERTLGMLLARAGWRVEAAFTLGLGAEEFFIRGGDGRATSATKRASLVPQPGRRLRHRLRDAFLGLGLG